MEFRSWHWMEFSTHKCIIRGAVQAAKWDIFPRSQSVRKKCNYAVCEMHTLPQRLFTHFKSRERMSALVICRMASETPKCHSLSLARTFSVAIIKVLGHAETLFRRATAFCLGALVSRRARGRALFVSPAGESSGVWFTNVAFAEAETIKKRDCSSFACN
jgi:hypothetical protein